jgi:aryl-alcohol dehydrogenase-like predicted oxidoreductase
VAAAQIALAWVHAQASQWSIAVVPIPGTRRVRYLEQNVAAVAIRLSPAELSRLNALAARVSGVRHPQLELTSAGGRE